MMKYLISLLFYTAGVSYANASFVSNGDFEIPGSFSGDYQSINKGGSLELRGWSLDSGGIDLINKYWISASGNYSIDIDSTMSEFGSISQEIMELVPGNLYKLSFAMSGNPDSGSIVKNLQVDIGDRQEYFSFDITGKTRENMGWDYKYVIFSPRNSSEILRFTSMEKNNYGPAIDNISINSYVGYVPISHSIYMYILSIIFSFYFFRSFRIFRF